MLNLKNNDFRIEAEMNLNSVKLGFKVDEVPIPHLRRCGGILKSKIASDPRMWFKIFTFVTNEIKDEKIKKKVKKMKIFLKNKIATDNDSKKVVKDLIRIYKSLLHSW
jgi:hypothetical protein